MIHKKLLSSLEAPELYDPDSFITIWRVSFDVNGPRIRYYEPQIPKSAMEGEDQETKRICFAGTIEQCIIAIPGDRRRAFFDKGSRLIAFPLRVSKDDPYLVIPDEYMVPDAPFTSEYWYTRPVTLCGEEMEIGNFAWGNYFFATELDRQQVYELLKEGYGFTDRKLQEFDQYSVFELVNHVLNSDPEYWEIDDIFGDTVADALNIPNNLLFDYLELLPV